MNKDILSDPEQVAELWQTLHRAARYRGATAAEADDIVQNSFVKALESPPTYRDRFAPWMRTVTERFTLRSRRTKRNRSHREQVAAKKEPVPSVLELLEEEDHRVTLRTIVDNLSAPYGEVVRLRYFDGLSVDEIAQRLGRTPVSVRKQISRGMRLLRERFQPRKEWHHRIPAWLWFRRKPEQGLPSLGVIGAIGATLLISLTIAFSIGTNEVELTSQPAPKAELEFASVTNELHSPPAEREALQPPEAASALITPEPYTVRVLVGYSAIKDAEIRISSKDQSTPGTLVGMTDEEGRLELKGVSADSWVSASRERMFPSNRFLLRGLGGARELTIKLTPEAGLLSGIVLSPDGKPLAGAKVTLSVSSDNRGNIRAHGTSHLSSQPTSRVAQTNDQGRFEVTKIRGQRYELCIEAKNYAPYVKPLTSSTKEDRHIECVMPAASTLSGIVLNSLATPIPGVKVTLELPPPLPEQETTTDTFGHYSFAKLPAGPAVLRAWDPDGEARESTLAAVQLAEGAETTYDLGLSSRFTLAGVAVDGAGGPLEGWTVELAPDVAKSSSNAMRRIQADHSGHFAFTACNPERAYDLRLYPPGSDHAVPDAILEGVRVEGTPHTLTRTALSYPTAHIRGQVDTSKRNRPALVVLTGDVLAHELYLDINSESGLFASQALPPGNYKLRACTPERGFGESLEVELKANEEQIVTLTRAKGVRLIRFDLQQWTDTHSTQYAPPVIVIQGEGKTRRLPIVHPRLTAPTDLDHGRYTFAVKRAVGWADATGSFVVTDDSPEIIKIELRPGKRVQLRVSAPRSLFNDEHAKLFVQTPHGEQEMHGMRAVSRQNLEALWELNVGLPFDCTKMRVTTNLGLSGECEFNLGTHRDDEELHIALHAEHDD